MGKKTESKKNTEVVGVVTGHFIWFAPKRTEVYTNKTSGKPNAQSMMYPKIKASIVVQTNKQHFTVNYNKIGDSFDFDTILADIPETTWCAANEEIKAAFPFLSEVALNVNTRTIDAGTDKERTFTRAFLRDE